MDQFAATRVADQLSLTDADIAGLRAGVPRLAGRWVLLTETGEHGDVYGRLLPPWGDGQHSAFLFERENAVVILTDNLSDPDSCRMAGFPSAAAAMEGVRRILLGEQA